MKLKFMTPRFFRNGFYILLIILAAVVAKGMIHKGKCITAKDLSRRDRSGVWFELASKDPKATQEFLTRIFETDSFGTGKRSREYIIIKAKDKPYPMAAIVKDEGKGGKCPSVFLAVDDYEESRGKMMGMGARTVGEAIKDNGDKAGTYTIPGEVDIGIIEYQD